MIPPFSADLGEFVPSFLDWCDVKSLVTLLKSFYDMVVRISGSLYVTFNSFFSEISNLSCMLDDMIGAESGSEKVKTYMLIKYVFLCLC